MHRFGATLIACAILLLQSAASAQACGDKFLILGRGMRYQRAYAAIHPATIVIYAVPQRNAAKAIRDPRLQADLKLAGHRVSLIDSEAALARALESDHVDLVLTDLADADRTAAQGAASTSKPTVLPVMYQPTTAQTRDVEARYQCRLKSSDRPDRYLRTIDEAMKARIEQRKRRMS